MPQGLKFKEEYYKCASCNKDFEGADLRKEKLETVWRCPDCKEYLLIHSVEKENKAVLMRKYPKDIKTNDLILLNRDEDDKIHLVYSNEKKGDKYMLKIKGFGSMKLKKGDWQNIKLGTW